MIELATISYVRILAPLFSYSRLRNSPSMFAQVFQLVMVKGLHFGWVAASGGHGSGIFLIAWATAWASKTSGNDLTASIIGLRCVSCFRAGFWVHRSASSAIQAETVSRAPRPASITVGVLFPFNVDAWSRSSVAIAAVSKCERRSLFMFSYLCVVAIEIANGWPSMKIMRREWLRKA
jgi:hypothetical protein